MKCTLRMRAMVLAIGTLAALMPVPRAALAAGPNPDRPASEASSVTLTIQDVALDDQRTLVGQLMDVQGIPLHDVPVSVHFQGQEVAQTTTGAQGEFAIAEMQPGLHLITAGDAVGAYRIWSADSAPPAATHGVLMVSDDELLRANLGQFIHNHGLGALLIAAGATAIIVIAIDQATSS